MANGVKKSMPDPSLAYHDFYKTNGGEYAVETAGPSLTRQEFAEECDINQLMKRYEGHVIGGPGNMPMAGEPFYADFSDMPTDLLGYMQMMEKAEVMFMQLPAVVRREFDNNAHEFVSYASDPANVDQMREWGLAPPAKAPPAPAASPPGASGEPAAPAPAPASPAPPAPK